MSPHLERLARRVQDDPFFLASILAVYARSEGLDDPALAAALSCTVAGLPPLRLCRAPRPEAPYFWQDVEQIAQHCRVNADTLAAMVRRGQSLLQLQQSVKSASTNSAGLLMAARDHSPEPPTTDPEGATP